MLSKDYFEITKHVEITDTFILSVTTPEPLIMDHMSSEPGRLCVIKSTYITQVGTYTQSKGPTGNYNEDLSGIHCHTVGLLLEYNILHKFTIQLKTTRADQRVESET